MSKGRIVVALLTIVTGLAAVAIVAANPVHHAEVRTRSWSFNGFFGSFDQAQLKRGHVIYKDICSGCHAMSLLAYRDLQDIGYTEDEVKAFAAEVQVEDGPDDTGEMFERPGRPSDHFKAPFPNEQASRAANNGALPPDLSLIAKSRAGAGFLGHDGADYIYSLMTGYEEPPAGVTVPDGMYYNRAFKGHQIAMPPPLSDGDTSLDEQAQDIAVFLTWAAEGNLEERHRTGIKAILFLVIFTLLAYTVKRRIWADVH